MRSLANIVRKKKKKTTCFTAEILDLCDKMRELKKKRFEPEGSEKHKEVNNNIKRGMKKANENWIGEQRSETEENLRMNYSKRAYQLVKDLTTVNQGKATTVQNRSGKCITEERQILNRWTEYCSELYNFKANGDPSMLNCPQVRSLKKGKSAEVDNIPAELLQAGGKDVKITALTTICDKIWQTEEWPTQWTQSLVITLPKKGNLQQSQNYRTISLISHQAKSC